MTSKYINLDLIYIVPPLYGVTIAIELKRCIEDWGLEHKLLAATSDSTWNCFLASKLLNGQKSKKTRIVFEKIIEFPNRCATYGLQTVVKSGFNAIDSCKDDTLKIALSKIRYIKGYYFNK